MQLASKLAIDDHVGQLVPTKAKRMKQEVNFELVI